MTIATRLSLEDFLRQPETKPASEYCNGEVIQKPMPTGKHGFIQTILASLLLTYFRANWLGVAITEWRCVFGPTDNRRAFVPDVTVALRSTHRIDADTLSRALDGAPDIAIEVLSPEQHAGEFADKLQFYLLHGVRQVWVFDPEAETARVYAPGMDPRLLRADDLLDGGDVLPGFTLSIRDLYADLRRWGDDQRP